MIRIFKFNLRLIWNKKISFILLSLMICALQMVEVIMMESIIVKHVILYGILPFVVPAILSMMFVYVTFFDTRKTSMDILSISREKSKKSLYFGKVITLLFFVTISTVISFILMTIASNISSISSLSWDLHVGFIYAFNHFFMLLVMSSAWIVLSLLIRGMNFLFFSTLITISLVCFSVGSLYIAAPSPYSTSTQYHSFVDKDGNELMLKGHTQQFGSEEERIPYKYLSIPTISKSLINVSGVFSEEYQIKSGVYKDSDIKTTTLGTYQQMSMDEYRKLIKPFETMKFNVYDPQGEKHDIYFMPPIITKSMSFTRGQLDTLIFEIKKIPHFQDLPNSNSLSIWKMFEHDSGYLGSGIINKVFGGDFASSLEPLMIATLIYQKESFPNGVDPQYQNAVSTPSNYWSILLWTEALKLNDSVPYDIYEKDILPKWYPYLFLTLWISGFSVLGYWIFMKRKIV